MMHGFEFYTPTRVIFGAGSLEKLPEAVGRCGAKRVFVVYGGQSAKKSGLLDRVEALLTGAGIAYAAIGGVKPNPRLGLAREAVREAIAFGADLILAVGGGSVIDTAKAAAHGAANPETDIWDIWLGKVKLEKSLPVGVVLTIPAAGSEMSDSAVLTDEVALAKRGLTTDLNRPMFALMDPALAATLPPRQAACGVTDIMMHTLERYVNPLKNDMTDEIAEALLRVVIRHGEAVVKNPGDIDAMSEIMWAGSLSHNNLTGLGGKKDFSVHQFGQAIGEKFDIYHGETLSAMWASYARYVAPTNFARFAQYARKVWGIVEADDEKAAMAGIDATEAYFKRLGMPVRIAELSCGVQDEAGLYDLALRCSRNRGRTIGSFRVLDFEDMLNVYQMANK